MHGQFQGGLRFIVISLALFKETCKEPYFSKETYKQTY
jgi:hypothetical protein